MGLSIQKYAEHRREWGLPGATKSGVQKALESGRICRGPDGKIDPELADEAWMLNTNPYRGGAHRPPEASPSSYATASNLGQPVLPALHTPNRSRTWEALALRWAPEQRFWFALVDLIAAELAWAEAAAERNDIVFIEGPEDYPGVVSDVLVDYLEATGRLDQATLEAIRDAYYEAEPARG